MAAAFIPNIDKNSVELVKDRLRGYIKNGTDQHWNLKAVQCCENVLYLIECKEPRGLFELEKAINTNNPKTECILITPMNLRDPRFTTHYIQYWPHVASCKLWGWPSLENKVTAIQPIEKFVGDDDNCHVTLACKLYQNICVNPFHYNNINVDVEKVERLRRYVKQSEDTDWENRITPCITKIGNLLDDNRMKKLETAIKTEDMEPTDCIIVSGKRKDGRLSVRKLRIWPHIASCRLWRWPDLKNTIDAVKPTAEFRQTLEQIRLHLASRGSCLSRGQSGFRLCINPFHYQRCLVSPCNEIIPRHSLKWNVPFQEFQETCITNQKAIISDIADIKRLLIQVISNNPTFSLEFTRNTFPLLPLTTLEQFEVMDASLENSTVRRELV